MYRLVLYYLIFLLTAACVYSYIGILPFHLFSLLFSIFILLFVCGVSNVIFAKVFHAPTNVESVYISALILALIITPAKSVQDLPLFIWAGVLSMASKYILAIYKKHIFNPVAIAVALTAFAFGGSASWWVGTLSMLPFVLLGFLIVRKIRKGDMVYYFFTAAFITMLYFSAVNGSNLLTALHDVLFASSLFFFAFIMLTEPLTTPPTKVLQIIYGIIVGILFVPEFHIGTFYTTPEIALVIGNIFSYLVSSKQKVMTTVKEKVQTSISTMDFLFVPEKKLSFLPGQYMEWTLPHKNADSRGNRRYFTIASSPTEDVMRLGVKFYDKGSSYKTAMHLAEKSTPFVGAQLSGDFTLPRNKQKKLVFIAGGIGITPFRSMIKYLIDKGEKRSIVLFYTNKTADEIVYADIFDQAQRDLGIKVIYTLTDHTKVPSNWQGKIGRINVQMIKKEVPDFSERTFYISGSNVLVTGIEETLRTMGISEKQIKMDFFPGLA